MRLLKMRSLDRSPAQILEIGELMLKETKQELEKLSKELYPDKTMEEVRDIIKNDHPKTFEDIMEEVRKINKEARAFIIENQLMKIPENEELKVVETPNFMAPLIPFAAYNGPKKFRESQDGKYYVTPIGERTEMFKEHSYAAIKNTAVHEGYPGHHLQISSANLQPSLIKTIAFAPELIEGWAFYCEELMAQKGFLGKRVQFSQLLDQVWRAVRIIVDIKLHSGEMSFEEAKVFMKNEIGMEEHAVISELNRYTATPGYQLSYLYGKYMMLELKEYIQKKMGAKFSEQFFHNTILNAGNIPITFLRRLFDIRLEKDV